MYSLSLIHKLIHIYPPPLDSPYDSSAEEGPEDEEYPPGPTAEELAESRRNFRLQKTDQPDMGVGTPGGNRVCHLGGRRLLGRTRGHGRGDNDDHGLAPDYLYIDVIGLYLYIRLYTTIYLYVDMSNYVGVFTYLYIKKTSCSRNTLLSVLMLSVKDSSVHDCDIRRVMCERQLRR